MTAIFSKPKGPDPQIAIDQENQRKALKKKEDEAEAKLNARKRSSGSRSGARFLLANAEAGTGGLASNLSTV